MCRRDDAIITLILEMLRSQMSCVSYLTLVLVINALRDIFEAKKPEIGAAVTSGWKRITTSPLSHLPVCP